MICADDHPDLVFLLSTMINKEKNLTAIEGAHNAQALVERVSAESPEIAVVDLTMPGVMEPIEAIRQIADDYPDTRVIAYSAYDDHATRESVAEAGAWGFVSKHDEISSLIAAIRTVAAGDVNF